MSPPPLPFRCTIIWLPIIAPPELQVLPTKLGGPMQAKKNADFSSITLFRCLSPLWTLSRRAVWFWLTEHSCGSHRHVRDNMATSWLLRMCNTEYYLLFPLSSSSPLVYNRNICIIQSRVTSIKWRFFWGLFLVFSPQKQSGACWECWIFYVACSGEGLCTICGPDAKISFFSSLLQILLTHRVNLMYI